MEIKSCDYSVLIANKIIFIYKSCTQQIRHSMNTKKKQSNGSEPTQPEPRKRFVRRNSFHTLHCRSGSLNKLANLSQELYTLQLNTKPDRKQAFTQRRQTVYENTAEINRELNSLKDMPFKRGTGSMRIQPEHNNKGCSSQKFQTLRKEYELRGQEIELLYSQCQRLKLFGNEQREKRKSLQQQARLNQLELKRIQKRAEKYRVERDQLQKNIELMTKHIEQLEKATFNKATLTLQSYRQQVLEMQFRRVQQILQKSRTAREQELIRQLDHLREQKYNQQQLTNRAQIANSMLMKQLEQAEQEMQEIRRGIHQTITASPQYSQLREKYRQALLQLREMRKEMSALQRGSGFLLQHTFLTISEMESQLE